MKNKNSKINLRDKYTELAKNSLVRVQYSCSGNTTPIEEFDFINYRQATDADFPEIINLLAECELPQSDVSAEKQNFIIAEIDHKIVACAGFEAYNEKALFRSLAVKPLHRNMQIAQVLTQKVIESGEEQGKCILLTYHNRRFIFRETWLEYYRQNKSARRNPVDNRIFFYLSKFRNLYVLRALISSNKNSL